MRILSSKDKMGYLSTLSLVMLKIKTSKMLSRPLKILLLILIVKPISYMMQTKTLMASTVRKNRMTMMMMMSRLMKLMKKAKMKMTRNNGNKKKESNKITDPCL